MKNTSLAENVQQYFNFLLDNYRFAITSSEPNLVMLVSNTCQMRVILDRYQVFVDFGPIRTSKWFDLSVVTAFLTQESGAGDWQYELPRGVTASKSIEIQFQRLAKIIREYISHIIPLFREKTFNHIEIDLIEFRKRRAEERRKRLVRK